MSVNVPKGYKVECVETEGTLEVRNGDIVFSPEAKIYDDYLKDTIAEVVYLDVEKAIEEFGRDNFEKALKGEKVNVKTKVCIFKKEFLP